MVTARESEIGYSGKLTPVLSHSATDSFVDHGMIIPHRKRASSSFASSTASCHYQA